MTNLVVRHRAAPSPNGLVLSVTRQSAGWSYVGFDVYRLSAGMHVERVTEGQELCVVILSGRSDISFGEERWSDVGLRETVFSGTPDAVYVPPGGVISITGKSPVSEVALCWAPATRGAEPRLLPASEVPSFNRGSGPTERTIHDILMESQAAESLLVTEVLTPGGHWSSWPPRKHDTNDPPRESYLEETYYFRTTRPQGFAVQTLYTDDRSLDEAIQVRDGDLVLVPRGYHSVSAGPGYDIYYLNVMAGPHRKWLATTDANHAVPTPKIEAPPDGQRSKPKAAKEPIRR